MTVTTRPRRQPRRPSFTSGKIELSFVLPGHTQQRTVWVPEILSCLRQPRGTGGSQCPTSGASATAGVRVEVLRVERHAEFGVAHDDPAAVSHFDRAVSLRERRWQWPIARERQPQPQQMPSP